MKIMKKTFFVGVATVILSFSALSTPVKALINLENSFKPLSIDRSEIVYSLNKKITEKGGFEKIMSSTKEDGTSAYLIAQAYRIGIVLDSDQQKALEYFLLSSKLGNKKANLMLWMILSDQDPKIKLNDAEKEKYQSPISYLVLSAKESDKTAQYYLGTEYIKGKSLAKDMDLALFWLSRSALQKNIEAKRLKYLLVYNIKEMQRNFEEARQRVINGDEEYLGKLAQIYEEGFIVEKSNKKAKRLLSTQKNINKK